MREHHDNPMAGHPGIGRTLGSIKQTYYWPTIENNVKTYVTGCQSCQRNKIIHQRRQTELHPHSIPEECWESISVDLIGPLPESKGCNTILAVIDRFSRMIRLIPTVTELTSKDLLLLYQDQIWKYMDYQKRSHQIKDPSLHQN